MNIMVTEEMSRELARQREEIHERLRLKNLEAEAVTIKLLKRPGRRAKAIIDGFMKRHEFDSGGCQTFYAPSEWRARKEKYGTDSVLVVVYDGGDLYTVMSHEFGHTLSDEIESDLRAEGFYIEACTGGYSAVYPIQGWKKPSS